MNVYVESNFLLELILEQEEHTACEELLRRAESNAIALVLPAYALIEPWETIQRRVREWGELGSELDKHLRELARTPSLQPDATSLRGLMVKRAALATNARDSVRARVLAAGRVIPIDAASLGEADRIVAQFGMKLPDALMLACVLMDAKPTDPSLFLNRNRSDFADPAVRANLQGVQCKLLTSFADGVAYLDSRPG